MTTSARVDPPDWVRCSRCAALIYRKRPHYDSLLAKVVVWAPDRELALNRMGRALDEFDVAGAGIHTTIPFLRRLIDDAAFRKGQHSTSLVDRLLGGSETADPAPASATRAGPDDKRRST